MLQCLPAMLPSMRIISNTAVASTYTVVQLNVSSCVVNSQGVLSLCARGRHSDPLETVHGTRSVLG